jgi:hypothetical protein
VYQSTVRERSVQLERCMADFGGICQDAPERWQPLSHAVFHGIINLGGCRFSSFGFCWGTRVQVMMHPDPLGVSQRPRDAGGVSFGFRRPSRFEVTHA